MGLNIKNERVHQLAKRAARATGTTQTGAIEQALVEYLERIESESRATEQDDELDRLLADMHRRVRAAGRAKGYAAMAALYDDKGLPA